MVETYQDFVLDDDRRRIDYPRVTGWLAGTYWSPGIPEWQVRKAADGSSMLLGAYAGDGSQVGYCRVVSDTATFAWIADVYVDEKHRKRGLALAMIQYLQRHPNFQGLRKWMLATRDAHHVYQKAGFFVVDHPERVMWWKPPTP